VVGARGGGVRGFGEGPGYLFGGEGGIVLIVREAEVREAGGLEGKKWCRSLSATTARSAAPGKSGNLCGGRPNVNLFAVQRKCGVAEDMKSDQCVFMAEAMALKYVLLKLFTLPQLRGDGSRRDILANLSYSLLRDDRRGDHHGF